MKAHTPFIRQAKAPLLHIPLQSSEVDLNELFTWILKKRQSMQGRILPCSTNLGIDDLILRAGTSCHMIYTILYNLIYHMLYTMLYTMLYIVWYILWYISSSNAALQPYHGFKAGLLEKYHGIYHKVYNMVYSIVYSMVYSMHASHVHVPQAQSGPAEEREESASESKHDLP